MVFRLAQLPYIGTEEQTDNTRSHSSMKNAHPLEQCIVYYGGCLVLFVQFQYENRRWAILTLLSKTHSYSRGTPPNQRPIY